MATQRLGPYPFSFPDLFTDLSVSHKPPLHRASAIASPGVAFDVAIVIGRGTEVERDELVAAMVEVLQPTYKANRFCSYTTHGHCNCGATGV